MAGYIIMFILMDLLLIGMGVPLSRRKVPQNMWYGLRVGETMANEEVWYEANEACGRDAIGLGLAMLVLTVGLAVIPWSDPEFYAILLTVVYFVAVLVFAGRGMALAREIHKRVKEK